MSAAGRDLQVGDYATTDFHRKAQRVRIIERLVDTYSQSGILFRVQTIGGRAMPDTYDADWFEPEAQQQVD